MTEKRPTNPPLAPIDLFPRVEAYYREGFVESRRGEDFDRWLAGARDHLRETATYDADPAFLLHVLVCTAGRGLRRYADQSPALKSLPKRHRAQLVGALKFLRERGEAWLQDVFGPAERELATTFTRGVLIFHTLLTGMAVTTPAWERAPARLPTIRDQKNALTACILCLHEAVQRAPKPVATVVVLLEKFALLAGRQSAATRAKFVEQRVRRKTALASDPLGPVGNVMFHLRGTFDSLKEFLASEYERARW